MSTKVNRMQQNTKPQHSRVGAALSRQTMDARRFAIFARVSTRDQLTGHSLDLQEQHARDYVARAGGIVVQLYSAQESATGKQEDRTILQRLLDDAHRGLF